MEDEGPRERPLIRETSAFAPPIGDAFREAGLSTGIDHMVAEQRSHDAGLFIFLWQQLLRDLVKEFNQHREPLPEPVRLSRLMRERLAWLERDSLRDWKILQRDPAYELELVRDRTRTREDERGP